MRADRFFGTKEKRPVLEPLPVGALFLSKSATNPTTTFGYGVWAATTTPTDTVGGETFYCWKRTT